MSNPNIRRFELVPGVVIEVEVLDPRDVEPSVDVKGFVVNGEITSSLSFYNKYPCERTMALALFPNGWTPEPDIEIEKASEVQP